MRPGSRRNRQGWAVGAAGLVALALGLATLSAAPVLAEAAKEASKETPKAEDEVAIPQYLDPNTRMEKPDLPASRVFKWATGDDYPPFHYVDAEGQAAGFAVDLARAICADLKIACTLQAWRWDALLDTIDKRQADVILAMVRPTPALRQRFAMTERVHQTPARFVARSDKALPDSTPEALKGHSVAVMSGSAHEAFLKAYFPGVTLKPYPKSDEARAAVQAGEADAAFGDAVSLAFWLNGTASENCCRFVGGPYVDARYFGEGIGALLSPSEPRLRQAIDYALQRLDENGVYAEIYLKHFPVGVW
ncbi:transporter substrate-binding domain-containing protein [Chelatococcus sambhunathii]|uniref:Transporter substrate-binding domain-containing protein n=1 Tax=Chelatococcus sambhunathii TaxID=363953 RepID=A0ABU1DGT0_9HYPH|nr:transporter substrate-binding domain-containing protein [Chelatococcus sambhunathii]MDR4307328.1 transporter substrate-binding domain-containing protein [Chelatococcus sambhunathii]